jgi:hypothetical protein
MSDAEHFRPSETTTGIQHIWMASHLQATRAERSGYFGQRRNRKDHEIFEQFKQILQLRNQIFMILHELHAR